MYNVYIIYIYIYIVIIIHRADGRGAQSPRGGNITTETEKGFAFPPLIRDNITCVFLINMRAGRPRLNVLYYYYTLALFGLSPSFSLTLSDSLSFSLSDTETPAESSLLHFRTPIIIYTT